MKFLQVAYAILLQYILILAFRNHKLSILIQEEQLILFYVALGDVVRTYLTHRTGLPLAEQTTSESVLMLNQKWTAAQIESYQFILTRADYVKFAKGSWDVAVHRDCLDKATALIMDFKPVQDV